MLPVMIYLQVSGVKKKVLSPLYVRSLKIIVIFENYSKALV